ncbi:Integral membrane protein TerC family protein [Evansella caseinilytica]|uniref:Integral membrane protein TerC family protein n=1 Tax=Evansella caseinilytica TaxID=1503961 RepID=A0A1H3ULM6_9BACI|nr:hypothetical protein [Evansella caseinilytica]SDZ63257.1 Integral membrane protein TerC family protein [Evansella caseinilytica]
MMEFTKIVLISFVSDLDNIIIYAAIFGRKVSIPLILSVTCLLATCRTISVVFVHQLKDIDGIELVIGFLLLFIAVKMATKDMEMLERRRSRIWSAVAYVAAVDLLLSLDGVLLVSAVSDTALVIFIGIGVTLFSLFYLSSLIFQMLRYITWIFIVVASYIGYSAMDIITKEELFVHWMLSFHETFPLVDFLPLFSRVAAIAILLTGIYSYSKNNRIHTVK